MKRLLLVLGWLGLAGGYVQAQSLSLGTYRSEVAPLSVERQVRFTPILEFENNGPLRLQAHAPAEELNGIPLDILPQYAKENPCNDSYLCQLEKKIEKKAPIPVWVRAIDPKMMQVNDFTNAYVRVKLLRW